MQGTYTAGGNAVQLENTHQWFNKGQSEGLRQIEHRIAARLCDLDLEAGFARGRGDRWAARKMRLRAEGAKAALAAVRELQRNYQGLE